MIDSITQPQEQKKLIVANQIDYHQFEGRDATLRVGFNNGIEIEVTNGHLSINYKDRFSVQVYEHDADEGNIGRPYDSVIVHPDGWRIGRKNMTAYHFSRDELGKYPELTDYELTKRAIPSFEACVLVTDETPELIRMAKEKQERLIAEAAVKQAEENASKRSRRKK